MSIQIPQEMENVFTFCKRDCSYQVLSDCEDLVPVMEQISRNCRVAKESYGMTMLDLSVLQLVVALGYHGKKTHTTEAGIRNEKIREILKYIQEHYQESLQIEELAVSRGISSRFLRRYFTQEIGMTPSEYRSSWKEKVSGS